MKKIRIEDAVGMVLGHDVTQIIPEKYKRPRFKRGHKIRKKDIPKFLKIGKEHVFVIKLKPSMIHEDDAALHLGKAFSGKNIKITSPSEGKVSLHSKINIPIDKQGADILLIHNAGEYLSWPENPAAFAILFEAAGLNWTLSSESVGYDAVNYGVWYDDIQLPRIAFRHARIAKDLKVKRIVIGECSHAHKASIAVADRILTGDLNIPRESCLSLLEHIVFEENLNFDPRRNDFPITLHDPCNMVHLMGIVEPQRRILRKICPQFREMKPRGVENYCCCGGSGFAIMSSRNFPDWRSAISGRIKMEQILGTFKDVINARDHEVCMRPLL